jgi:hypothetical protein
MTFVTRDLSIAYGGVTIGAASQVYIPDGYFSLTRDYPTGRLEFDVVCRGATHAALQTSVDALVVAFRKIRQDTTVTINSQTVISWSHSSNTGMNSRASLVKAGGQADTALARSYHCVIEVDLPADLSGVSGRQSSSVRVSAGPNSIRTTTITATYTALSSNSATAQMLANINTYAGAVKTAVGITAWERTSRDYTYDDQNKTVTVSDEYLEIKVNQSSAGLDHAAIKQPSLTISRRTFGPGDFRAVPDNVRRLAEVTASFSCQVDVDETLDLDSLWRDTVKPYMVDQTLAAFDGNANASLDSQSPLQEQYGNTLGAELVFSVVDAGSLVRQEWRYSISVATGRGLRAVWDGDPLAKEEFQGPASIVETQTLTREVASGATAGGIVPLTPGVNSGISTGLFSSFLAGEIKSGGSGGALKASVPVYGQVVLPSTRGHDGYTIDTTNTVTTRTVEYYRRPKAGGFVVSSPTSAPGVPGVVKLPGETNVDKTMPVPV